MTEPRARVAVVGATGAVGEVVLSVLAERFGRDLKIYALASEASVGREVSYGRQSLIVDDLNTFDFHQCDYAIFAAGGAVSAEMVPKAVEAGVTVIDNSAHFRSDEAVPLVVPEVNLEVLQSNESRIVANPNCSTIQMVVALAPIHRVFGIQRIVVSTYQSVSGAGKSAMEELGRQAMDRFNFREPKPEVFSQPIGFNLISVIGEMDEQGFSQEEMKLRNETRRLLNSPRLEVHATAVRVPVFVGHAEAVYVETERAIDIDEVMNSLRQAPGVTLAEPGDIVTPLTHGVDQDSVWVSRVRAALDQPHGLHLWVVADNLRKGAALNAIQILEALIESQHAAKQTQH